MLGFLPKPRSERVIEGAIGPRGGTMPRPQSIADAALWMQIACKKLEMGTDLSAPELRSLVGISDYMSTYSPAGSTSELSNAFWPQMSAVFLDRLGDAKGARARWLDASNRLVWKDYQASRLLDDDNQMTSLDGAAAWHLASVYYQRDFSIGPILLQYTEKLLKGVGEKSKEDVTLRNECLKNAGLIAVNARSIQMLRYARQMGDLASMPPGDVALRDPASVSKARGEFYASLVKLGYDQEATTASMIYSEMDSHAVMTTSFKPADNAARWSALSVATASLPGALILLTLVGAITLFLGMLVDRYALNNITFSWPVTAIVSVLLCAASFALSRSILVSFVTLLCALCLGATTKSERKKLPPDVGIVTGWLVAIMSTLFFLTIFGYLFESGTPGRILLPHILAHTPIVRVPEPSLFIGLSVLIVSVMILVAPMWAAVRRVPTPFAAGLVFRTFGRTLLTMGLAGIVVLVPLCIYGDYQARNTLGELVGNEPYHYVRVFE